jgi:hypothetical protein
MHARAPRTAARVFAALAAIATASAADIGSDASPVVVPQLSAAFTVDADPAKWAAIPALPAPFSRKASGMLKLAWRPEGIYGLLQTADDRISVDAFSPWTRDCLELWLETDCAHAYDMSAHSYQIALAPNPDAGPGRGVVIPAQGRLDKEKVQLAWKPGAGGYVLEFMIPAGELQLDAKPGTRIGMNYAVDLKSLAIEEFFDDKDMDAGWGSPCRWGTIVLGR